MTDPLAPGLLGDSAWPDYIIAYQAWSAADPDRLDLGTLFSSDFLFANLLQQTPDSGLVLNEDEIDPLSGTISFSILPLFDSNSVSIQLPAMLESRRRTRVPQLRKRLARLTGSLWSSTNIREAIAPLYANLGLTPQVLLLPRNQTIQIVEGPRLSAEVGALAAALEHAGAAIERVPVADTVGTRGRGWVTAVETSSGLIDCDLVAVAATPSPASEGARQQGCRVVLDPDAGGFKIVVDDAGRTFAQNVWACGDVTGYRGTERAARDGERVGANVAAALGAS